MEEFLVRLDKQAKQYKTTLFKIAWYMRGGVNVNDLFDRYTIEDIDILHSIIKENIETTKATQLPLI